MKRLNDEEFIFAPEEERTYTNNSIIAIRIKNGEYYFIGRMEDAEFHAMQFVQDHRKCKLNKANIIGCGSVYREMENCEGYNKKYYDWGTDENGKVLHGADKKFQNRYECFLSHVECNKKKKESYEGDHEIFMLSMKEFCSFMDVFKDGEYVFILKEDTIEDILQEHFIEEKKNGRDEVFYSDLFDKGFYVHEIEKIIGKEEAEKTLNNCIDHGLLDIDNAVEKLFERIVFLLKVNICDSNNNFWGCDDKICCHKDDYVWALYQLFNTLSPWLPFYYGMCEDGWCVSRNFMDSEDCDNDF